MQPIEPQIQRDTPSWIFFVWASFVTALVSMCIGIYNIPVDFWIRGYLAMGLFFTVGSSFTLAKTLRDNFEAQRQSSRLLEGSSEHVLRTGLRGTPPPPPPPQ